VSPTGRATETAKPKRGSTSHVENVTDRVRNPFGHTIPGDGPAVYGYGDANADVHVIGDSPAVHGGVSAGIPFTGTAAGLRLLEVLAEVGLIEDAGEETPRVRSLYLSYLHPGVTEERPTEAEYADQERFLDAEVRAITAHLLVPVGARATAYVLEHYTADPPDVDSMAEHHATEFGTGSFLVVPAADPASWSAADAGALRERLSTVLGRDFRRQTDLGRFLVGPDPYYVR
jgi:uracil-DNA glycosylase family 4